MNKLTNFYHELRRRRVFAVVALYAVAAWVVIQIGDLTIEAGMVAGLTLRNLFVLAIIGFPLALIGGWFYDITKKGIVRTAPAGADGSFKTSLQFKDYLLLLVLLIIWSGAFVYVHTPPVVEKSIAVMQFENRGNDPGNVDFAIGIHDSLMTQLQRIEDLKLIAQSSVSKIDPEASIQNTGMRLGAAYIMKGSVERVLDRIRVSVVLIDTVEEQRTWAGSFDRELSAVNHFDIRDEITSAITDNLQTVLSPNEELRVFDQPTSSTEALTHYVHGRQLMTTRGTESLKQALQEFEQAVDIDPEFALAWVGVADTSYLLKSFGYSSPSEGLANQKRAVEKALALDDQLGEAYASLAMMHEEAGNPEEAKIACQKSVKLSPNYARAYQWCSHLFAGSDSPEKQLAMYHKAARLDPLSSIIQLNIGMMLNRLGNYDEALDQYNHLLQIDPDFALTYSNIGSMHERNGRLADAIQMYRKALELNPGNPNVENGLALGYLILDNFEAIESVRKLLAKNQSYNGNLYSIALDARISLAKGEWAKALELLNNVPPEQADHPWVRSWKGWAHFARGDLLKAREFWVNSNPRWTDPAQWGQSIKMGFGCSGAGIFLNTSDESLGRDLLRQSKLYWEETLPAQVLDSDRDSDLWACYLVEESYEKALDYYEQKIAHGHISNWWKDRVTPWWDPIRDHPRYILMVNKIEKLKAEQRELLRQMDEAGTTVP